MHGHAKQVARLAVGAARRLRLADAEVEHLPIAALLHDLGRIAVSNAVDLRRCDRWFGWLQLGAVNL